MGAAPRHESAPDSVNRRKRTVALVVLAVVALALVPVVALRMDQSTRRAKEWTWRDHRHLPCLGWNDDGQNGERVAGFTEADWEYLIRQGTQMESGLERRALQQARSDAIRRFLGLSANHQRGENVLSAAWRHGWPHPESRRLRLLECTAEADNPDAIAQMHLALGGYPVPSNLMRGLEKLASSTAPQVRREVALYLQNVELDARGKARDILLALCRDTDEETAWLAGHVLVPGPYESTAKEPAFLPGIAAYISYPDDKYRGKRPIRLTADIEYVSRRPAPICPSTRGTISWTTPWPVPPPPSTILLNVANAWGANAPYPDTEAERSRWPQVRFLNEEGHAPASWGLPTSRLWTGFGLGR